MLMSPANRFHMPPPSMKAMPGDPVDPLCAAETAMMEELDAFCGANGQEHPDCTAADHHTVSKDEVAHESSDRLSDVPQGLLLRPRPRRSHDVDVDDGRGLHRRVSWSDPVPLWSVDHLSGVAQGGAMSPREHRSSMERALPSSGGRASLELEYNTAREWEVLGSSPSALLDRSSV